LLGEVISLLDLERKKQITDAAASLFSEQGYVAAGMRQLAVKLGIEAASIYSHVKNKEELLHEICFDIANQFFELMKGLDSQRMPFLEKLELAIKGHIELVMNNANAAQVFLFEWKHLTQPALGEYRQMRRIYEDWFISLIRAGAENGSFYPTDGRFEGMTILASMNSLIQWNKREKADLDKLTQTMCRLYLTGLQMRNAKEIKH